MFLAYQKSGLKSALHHCIGGDWVEPTVDESRNGLEGAGASEKGGDVNRAWSQEAKRGIGVVQPAST